MLQSWGDRRIAMARELTKKFEEFFRGTITEATKRCAEGVRGELTLVVEGFREEQAAPAEQENWEEQLASLLENPDQTVKQATAEIVRQHRLPRRLVYQKALEMRGKDPVRKKRIG